jgi:phosphohistidine phosphatase
MAMDLYVLRHAIAVERGTPGVESDFDRDLTAEGERKLRQIAKTMRQLGIAFESVWSSPYVRARRTAEIVLAELKCRKRVELRDNLGVESNPRELVAEMKAIKQLPATLLLVGHEPFLSSLISLLITGSARSCVALKKAGFAKLTVDSFQGGGGAILQWLLTPRQMLLMK